MAAPGAFQRSTAMNVFPVAQAAIAVGPHPHYVESASPSGAALTSVSITGQGLRPNPTDVTEGKDPVMDRIRAACANCGADADAGAHFFGQGGRALVRVPECARASLLAPCAVVRGGASSGRRALVCGIRYPPWGRRPLPPRPRGARVGDTPGLGAVVDGDHLPSRPAVRRITLPARQPQLTPSRLSTPHSSSLGLRPGRDAREGRADTTSVCTSPAPGRACSRADSCSTPPV